MDTEIIIAGGGLVGNALAIALAQGGVKVVVIDPLPRASQLDAGFDGRTSAISSGTVRILSHLKVWPEIAPHAQAIHDIRVCDQDKPGFVHYSDTEVGEPFGYIVENQFLRRALYQGLEGEANIRVIEDTVTGFTTTPASATVMLAASEPLTAPLLIAADGRFSKLREQAGIAARVIAYDQTAIVCVVEHEHPHDGLALEKFYPAGPFALLPLKPSNGVHRSGVVWTEHESDAAQYVGLSDAEFTAELQRRVGEASDNYWGNVSVVGKRFAYPLKLMHAESFTAHRFALVGDAAHGIHPIAGQGVNLGYRDVAVLAELILDQRKLGLDVGAASVLAHYQRWRRFDSFSMTASTDLLNRLFSNDLPGLSLIRRAGMVAVNNLPPLKRYFMKHAMGLIGDLPAMMKDERATSGEAGPRHKAGATV